MTENVPLHEATDHLPDLIERAMNGEDIVIKGRGDTAVRLTPVPKPSDAQEEDGEPRTLPFGILKGKIWIADDFDDPLPDDLLKAFYGLGPDEPWPDEEQGNQGK